MFCHPDRHMHKNDIVVVISMHFDTIKSMPALYCTLFPPAHRRKNYLMRYYNYSEVILRTQIIIYMTTSSLPEQ